MSFWLKYVVIPQAKAFVSILKEAKPDFRDKYLKPIALEIFIGIKEVFIGDEDFK